MKITTIDELKVMAGGEVVELAPFQDGKPFVVRLKKPSLLNLAKNGQIPNPLLNAAATLFFGAESVVDEDDTDFLVQMHDVMELLAEASFVEPTWKEIKEAGIELTDEQYLDIYQYSQMGVKGLASFREKSANTGNNQSVENL